MLDWLLSAMVAPSLSFRSDHAAQLYRPINRNACGSKRVQGLNVIYLAAFKLNPSCARRVLKLLIYHLWGNESNYYLHNWDVYKFKWRH